MGRKFRNTRQKEIIKEEVSKLNTFFTAEDLLKKVQNKDPKLGIATVYRFLNEMVKERKIHSYVCDRKNLYSLEKNSHCHFICEKTGKVLHFEINNLDFIKQIKSEIPGAITSIQLEIKGICDDCSDLDKSK